jgi:hypothetical protein
MEIFPKCIFGLHFFFTPSEVKPYARDVEPPHIILGLDVMSEGGHTFTWQRSDPIQHIL